MLRDGMIPGDAMMSGLGLLVVVLLALGIAALVKYLFQGDR
jgi:hypothetical protein